MKGFLIAGGLFIIIFICIIPLPREIEEFNTERTGEMVTVTITYIPICSGTKGKHFMKFIYKGETFDKDAGCGFDETHKLGE